MSKARNTFARRVTAGLGIAAVATAALFGSMVPANAVEATPGPGNINEGTVKSLTIHKFAQPATSGKAPNGLPLAESITSGLTPLKGVTFQIQKVNNIDLSKNEGWAATSGLTPAAVQGHLDAAVSGVTNAEGIFKFDNLAQAVYLVTETNPGANNIAFAAQPFLVTLPLPNNTDNTWIYDVHVYPKNALASVTKAVDDSAAKGLGSNVTWNIAAKVPNKSQGNALNKFEISDTLDARLSYKGAAVTLASGAALVADVDYVIDTTTVSGTVTIKFLAPGLAKFAADETVNVALTTAVTSLGNESGVISNDATVFINDKDFTSNEVETTWGNVVIHKVAANDNTKSLQGAEFQVYASEADAKSGNNPISVSGKTTFTTAANGIVAIDGLRATVNGTKGAAVDYWLVETKAPAGYDIAADFSKKTPKKFNVVAGKVSTDINFVVADPQTPPFTLPLTGGPGSVAFMTVGFGLLAIAGGVALRKRSSRRVANS